MPANAETALTMTITLRIDGHDHVAGKQFVSDSRGIPAHTAAALGDVALGLLERIEDEAARGPGRMPKRHS
jgi:hypothetical protein